jgi:hypothetical protein
VRKYVIRVNMQRKESTYFGEFQESFLEEAMFKLCLEG